MRGKGWILALLTAAGCPCGGSYTQRPFACGADQDCADGWSCVQGVCALGAGDGGGPDAGATIDAGTADGGAGDGGRGDGGTDGGTDAGDPCGPAAGPLPGGGETAAYCALHRTVVIDGRLDDWNGVPFTPLTHQSAQSAPGSWTGTPAVDDPDLSGAFA